MKQRASIRPQDRSFLGLHLRSLLIISTLFIATLAALLWLRSQADGPSLNFGSSILQGNIANNPTSLQFGPDGRLYVAEQYGRILAYKVVRKGTNDYHISAIEIIELVKNIPNYNDNTGARNHSVDQRQVTGLVVTGTADHPVLYVSSSDPRIGAGGGGHDLNLDTNSGIISRLSWDGTQWEKVDLVRGLPRSEENHAGNGMHLSLTGDTLFATSAGFTNAGSPSNGFAFITEYALGVAILSIDLLALDAMPVKTDAYGQAYVYDLPTVDDPTRPNLNGIADPADPQYDGVDIGDPFGGNDGLNQARMEADGPVQIYSPGYRNAYDIEITQAGRMYTIDNGGNGGWGGYPENEGPPTGSPPVSAVTNNYVPGEPGYVNNLNGFHYVRGKGYYGGHPCPIRANPAGAGLYTYGDSGVFRTSKTGAFPLPADWPPVPLDMANPVEGDFRLPGPDNGSLVVYDPSTNGLVEYTATNFSGSLQGDILSAGYTGEIFRAKLNQAGDSVINGVEVLFSGFGMQPLDVIAQGDDDIFGGTIWVADYGNNNLYIFEPADYAGASVPLCDGLDDNSLDEDGDGYTNADEIDNGTNPCSAASKPADRDSSLINGFLVSDLNDPDDDDDGLQDLLDPFAIDPENGLGTHIPLYREFFNDDPGTGFFGLGFTGLMLPGGVDYLSLYEPVKVIAGGTAGLLTWPADSGSTENNDQGYAFQFGVNVHQGMCPFVVKVRMLAPTFGGATPTGGESQGFYIGVGDQNNYVKMVADSGISLIVENDGALTRHAYAEPKVGTATTLDLYYTIDPALGTLQAAYAVDRGGLQTVGAPIALQGYLLNAIQDPNLAMAVGLIAYTGGGNSFNATWDYLSIQPQSSQAEGVVRVDPPGDDIHASTQATGSFLIENHSPNQRKIERVSFDLATAWLPELVFDPEGNAGDDLFKDVAIDAGEALTGYATHQFLTAHGGGYRQMEMLFSDFEPGESFAFSLDIDPGSVQGTTAPGPELAAHVSGLELAGTLVTLYFDDCSQQQVALAPVPGTQDASRAEFQPAMTDQPLIEVEGLMSPATTTELSQVVRVIGPAGAAVALIQAAGGLAEATSGGHHVDPASMETNVLTQLMTYSATLDQHGQVEVPVNLLKSSDGMGINHFTAVVQEAGKAPNSSRPFLVKLDEPYCPEVRLNVGGAAYTPAEGQAFLADQYFQGGGTYSTSNNISGTTDDLLYQSERYAANLVYEIPVSQPGQYRVLLHFAEIWFGFGAGSGGEGGDGSRVFDIMLEGRALSTGYDIHAAVGPNAASILTYALPIADGALSLELVATNNNAKLSAIEVLRQCEEGSSFLPVELLRFDAQPTGTEVQLQWETASEIEHDRFVVERAADGQHFQAISEVEGRGESQGMQFYESFDTHPLTGPNYYRLQMVDVDGGLAYSPIVEVWFKPQFVMYPNPVRLGETLKIQLGETVAGPIQLRLASISGQVVYQQAYRLEAEETRLEIPIQNLSPGTYMLLLEAKNENGLKRYVQRVAIQR